MPISHYSGRDKTMNNLTKKEQEAINILRHAAKAWPQSLWLFSANGTLFVMKNINGKRAMTNHNGVDQNYIVTTIDIDNDGGDW